MNDDIVSSQKMIMNAFNLTNIQGNELPTVWRKVVSKVGENNKVNEDEISFGEKLANNSHVVDLKNGVLLIEANHPGWIQYLKMYERFILKGLKMQVPNLTIKNLAFRVAGSQVSLSESYEESLRREQQKMNERIDQQEQKLNNFYKQSEPKRESKLPQELLDKFESMKQSMLTNTQK